MRLRPLAIAAACAAVTLSCNALAQEAPAVSEAALRAHLSFLADDLLEGRGTASAAARWRCATSKPRPPRSA
jgi:hypothetical protein